MTLLLLVAIGAPAIEVSCSTLAVDREGLERNVALEIGDIAVDLACEGTGVRARVLDRSLFIPLQDVAPSARARTIALAIAEDLRAEAPPKPDPPDPPPPARTATIASIEAPAVVETVTVAPRRLGWTLAPSLEGFSTIDAEGLFAGAAFEVTRSIRWVSFFGGAMLAMGRADQKANLLLSFRTGIGFDLDVSDTVAFDLMARIEGGPVIGFGGNPGLGGYIGGGPGVGLRWAFDRWVHLRVLFATIFIPPGRPLFTLSLGVGFDLLSVP